MQLNQEIKNLPFDLPKNQSNVIKVIGVGGGGRRKGRETKKKQYYH